MTGRPDVAKLQAFGRSLEEWRLARTLSHAEAAEAADISKTTWQNIERGGRRYNGTQSFPLAKNIVKAGRAMGLPREEILALAGYTPRPLPAVTQTPSALRQQALDLVTHMPEENLPMTVGALRSLAEAKPVLSPLDTEVQRAEPEHEDD
ncbi:helix-turn-helix domain-containing protein [Actinokineospora spheciospongiae]|uniref:helix-turn-helix domain-containing protein n=1 Tax=Actinokineospora spheciospongiae TaxID=909613 RepID=UPI000D70FA58|nr:helix-turn-helix transcriptional regulator [Actinokineospora spheciospongiae]PWW65641.1 helix-turn-helix protein [Actinokineospora spheciospongiae]